MRNDSTGETAGEHDRVARDGYPGAIVGLYTHRNGEFFLREGPASSDTARVQFIYLLFNAVCTAVETQAVELALGMGGEDS